VILGGYAKNKFWRWFIASKQTVWKDEGRKKSKKRLFSSFFLTITFVNVIQMILIFSERTSFYSSHFRTIFQILLYPNEKFRVDFLNTLYLCKFLNSQLTKRGYNKLNFTLGTTTLLFSLLLYIIQNITTAVITKKCPVSKWTNWKNGWFVKPVYYFLFNLMLFLHAYIEKGFFFVEE
jgi:hypothetical protein